MNAPVNNNGTWISPNKEKYMKVSDRGWGQIEITEYNSVTQHEQTIQMRRDGFITFKQTLKDAGWSFSPSARGGLSWS